VVKTRKIPILQVRGLARSIAYFRKYQNMPSDCQRM
jgi:hypothetical protein